VAEIEARAKAEGRPLTSEEEREVKRLRRLMKNREAAHQSRMRKKAYVEQLEQRVQQLAEENLRVHDQLRLARAEVETLKAQIGMPAQFHAATSTGTPRAGMSKSFVPTSGQQGMNSHNEIS
jgi:hypothetical protein